MPLSITRVPIAGSNPGTAHSVAVLRFGTAGARPKAYVQAGLHADEIPGMLAVHHLTARLAAAEARGEVLGEILVVPSANPLGLDQFILSRPIGRFDLGGGGNFNRHYPDLGPVLANGVRDILTHDAAANVARIRTVLAEALDGQHPGTEVDHLRHVLLRMAIDADIVLDLHCDDEAEMHVYLGTPLWPDAEVLTRQLGARAVLLADISGGHPFDEACSSPWWRLRGLIETGHPIPAACLAATVELRGLGDVSDDFALQDADNLFRFLQRRGAVAGDPGPLPPALCAATPLAGFDMVAAPVGGIVVYRVELGDQVNSGDAVAEIVDPLAANPARARTPALTKTAGRVCTRRVHRFARPGDTLVKIAGAEPLPGKTELLLTAR